MRIDKAGASYFQHIAGEMAGYMDSNGFYKVIISYIVFIFAVMGGYQSQICYSQTYIRGRHTDIPTNTSEHTYKRTYKYILHGSGYPQRIKFKCRAKSLNIWRSEGWILFNDFAKNKASLEQGIKKIRKKTE